MAEVSPFLQLKKIASMFGEGSATLKLQLLETCSQQKISGNKLIKLYHDTLLFLLAYPENEILRDLASKEMQRLAAHVKNLNATKKESLDRSGIAYTATQGAYSFSLIKWLTREYPGKIAFHSFDEEGIHSKEIFKHVLPEMEFEISSNESLNSEKWLKKCVGTNDKVKLLHWLITNFDKLNCSEAIKEQLFESLKLFISIDQPPPDFSRTFGRVKTKNVYYHTTGLLKKFDEKELITRKFPSEKKLSGAEKNEIIKASRIALFLLNRETDPVTYCNENGLRYFELEHGLSIALFSMLPEKRLPLESYIGFMMFKNGYPMSYGGAWLFGKRSLIGINIFEAFRGGESAFVFAQLMRTYHMVCGADYFEVEPYQFGKNNPEGIQSGAFWFYYRFGYRPLDKQLLQLSQGESEKIKADKNYRSSFATLKAFTKSNVAVNFSGDNKPLNPSEISTYLTSYINKHFKGDRALAEKTAYEILKKEFGIKLSKTHTGVKKLEFFLAFCLDAKKLSVFQKKKITDLIEEKVSDEFKYIRMWRNIDLEKIVNLK